eukprot:645582-Hanusia_phi.AAC.1
MAVGERCCAAGGGAEEKSKTGKGNGGRGSAGKRCDFGAQSPPPLLLPLNTHPVPRGLTAGLTAGP